MERSKPREGFWGLLRTEVLLQLQTDTSPSPILRPAPTWPPLSVSSFWRSSVAAGCLSWVLSMLLMRSKEHMASVLRQSTRSLCIIFGPAESSARGFSSAAHERRDQGPEKVSPACLTSHSLSTSNHAQPAPTAQGHMGHPRCFHSRDRASHFYPCLKEG